MDFAAPELSNNSITDLHLFGFFNISHEFDNIGAVRAEQVVGVNE